MSTSLNWVKKNIFYKTDVPLASLEEVIVFPFIWGAFERELCSNRAKLKRVKALTNKIEPHIGQLESEWQHFKSRYTNGNTVNQLFDTLWTNPEGMGGKVDVESALLNTNPTPAEKGLALLIIAWRFRNQYFHGIKQFDDPDAQNDNYREVNSVLRLLIDNC